MTALNPTTAPNVVDLQKRVLNFPTVRPPGDVMKDASALASSFRRGGLPVI